MKTYRVAICFEEGVTVRVKAETVEDAERKAYELAEEFGGSVYPSKYDQECVHRDYFTQDAEEIK